MSRLALRRTRARSSAEDPSVAYRQDVPSGGTACSSHRRRRADSNRCTRLCRPLPNHSATAPPRHRSDPSVTPPGPPPLYLRQSNNRGSECTSVAVSLRSLSSSFCWLGFSKTTNPGALHGRPLLFRWLRPGPFLRSGDGERGRSRALPTLQRDDGMAPRHLAVPTLSPEARLL